MKKLAILFLLLLNTYAYCSPAAGGADNIANAPFSEVTIEEAPIYEEREPKLPPSTYIYAGIGSQRKMGYQETQERHKKFFTIGIQHYFTERFGLMFSANFREHNFEENVTSTNKIEMSTSLQMYNFGPSVRSPITDKVELFGNFGISYVCASIDSKFLTKEGGRNFSDNKKVFSGFLEGGIRYRPFDNFHVQAIVYYTPLDITYKYSDEIGNVSENVNYAGTAIVVTAGVSF